jgi:hypothetical protein
VAHVVAQVLEWAPDVNQTPLERSKEVARLIDDDAKLNERRVVSAPTEARITYGREEQRQRRLEAATACRAPARAS